MFSILLASGVASGLIYGLIALGIVVLVKATGGVNFAHGDAAVLGGFCSYAAVVSLQFGYGAALVIAVVAAVLVGQAFFATCGKLFHPKHASSLLIATIGLSFIVKGVSRAIWGGKGDYLSVPPILDGRPIMIGQEVAIPLQQVATALGTCLILAVFFFIFRYTSVGLQMRAVADNPKAATLVGIKEKRILCFAFVLSLVVASVSGVLAGSSTLLYPDLGFSLFVKGFAAALLGGMTSLPGAVVGGILIGIIENLASGYISTNLHELSTFLVIFFTLIFIPNGLFARERRRAV